MEESNSGGCRKNAALIGRISAEVKPGARCSIATTNRRHPLAWMTPCRVVREAKYAGRNRNAAKRKTSPNSSEVARTASRGIRASRAALDRFCRVSERSSANRARQAAAGIKSLGRIPTANTSVTRIAGHVRRRFARRMARRAIRAAPANKNNHRGHSATDRRAATRESGTDQAAGVSRESAGAGTILTASVSQTGLALHNKGTARSQRTTNAIRDSEWLASGGPNVCFEDCVPDLRRLVMVWAQCAQASSACESGSSDP